MCLPIIPTFVCQTSFSMQTIQHLFLMESQPRSCCTNPMFVGLNPLIFGQQLPFALRRFYNRSMFDGQMERIPVFSSLICIFGRVNPICWLVKPPFSRLHHNKKTWWNCNVFPVKVFMFPIEVVHGVKRTERNQQEDRKVIAHYVSGILLFYPFYLFGNFWMLQETSINYPLEKRLHHYGKWPFWIGRSPISTAIF